MNRSERVKSLGGKGGLRCPCCGGHGANTTSGKANKRRMVRQHRRSDRHNALAEGWADHESAARDTTPP